MKCVFSHASQLLSETLLNLRRIQRDSVINVQMFLYKVLFHSCQILMKLELD
jgi:hypothetical protein